MKALNPFAEALREALFQADDELLELAIRAITRDELASLGGHLLGEYGQAVSKDSSYDMQDETARKALAKLGGYLTSTRGDADAIVEPEPVPEQPPEPPVPS